MNNSRFVAWMTWALVLGMFWTVISRVSASQSQVQLSAVAKEGFAAPDFTLDLLGGGKVTLADLRGKVVFVNFWTSWCPPCRLEMPAIEKTYRSYKDLGFVVIGVNLTHRTLKRTRQTLLRRSALRSRLRWIVIMPLVISISLQHCRHRISLTAMA